MRWFTDFPSATDELVLQYLNTSLSKSVLEDLEKSKNRTGLVQVERTVYKKGTTFTQKFWIRPDRFMAGDKILQGSKNLDIYLNKIFTDKEKKLSKKPKEFTWADDAYEYFGLDSYDRTKGKSFVVWSDTLDEDEKDAIEQYTNFNYKVVNNYLRGKGELDDWDTIKAQKIIKPLEKAIDRFELKDDIIVHRKMSANVINMFKVGDIWQDDAFVSTTPIKGSFIPLGDDDTQSLKVIDMVIHVKAGKGVGAWVAPISEFRDENEFLLNRGTRFRVKRIGSNFEGGHVVELEVIDRKPEDLRKSVKHTTRITQSHMDKFTWSVQDIKLVSKGGESYANKN